MPERSATSVILMPPAFSRSNFSRVEMFMPKNIRQRIHQSNTLALLHYEYTRPYNALMETNYAKWLKDLLKRHGITEYVLAQRSGVPQPTINRITRGETKNPKSDTLAQLAIAVGESYGSVAEAKVHAHLPPPDISTWSERPLGISEDAWRVMPAAAKALISVISKKSASGDLTEDDLAFVTSTVETLSKKNR
ncbi:MAG: helix-turn-helix domain-containing protein [Gammaproteobacteria bacterium]|nr:helix-turn-helix domain-containing protein [Gammaproteobacteria bacterium]